MADVHDKATRSYNMSRIRSKNTKPEMIVRKFLFSQGFRYRLHVKNLPGKPDLVFPKLKTVIFVHGCFWHGHDGCRYFVLPKTRSDWWRLKIESNRNRDARTFRNLKLLGWRVITVFQCRLKSRIVTETLEELMRELKSPAVD